MSVGGLDFLDFLDFSVISFLIFGIGYFLILFRKDNKSLSDLLTKTQIIDLKKT